MKLDDRAKVLLKALIERYIAEGQPVGSRTLSRASGLELSPATIRNDMAELESTGLVQLPRTGPEFGKMIGLMIVALKSLKAIRRR